VNDNAVKKTNTNAISHSRSSKVVSTNKSMRRDSKSETKETNNNISEKVPPVIELSKKSEMYTIKMNCLTSGRKLDPIEESVMFRLADRTDITDVSSNLNVMLKCIVSNTIHELKPKKTYAYPISTNSIRRNIF